MKPVSNSFTKNISACASFGARLAFAVTVVITPLRARHVLLERPAPPVYGDFTDFLLFASDISIVVVLILWWLSLLGEWRPPSLGPKFIWIPILGLCLAGAFSTASSLDSALSLYHVLRLIILFLFYLYVVNEVHSPAIIVLSVAIQLVVQSVFAVGQFFLQYSLGLKSLGEHELDPAISSVSVVSDGSIRLLRAYGLAEHPNILGGCLAFSLILLLAAYLYGNRQARKGIMLAFLLGLLALLATFSRSAWLAFLVGSVLLVGLAAVSRGWYELKSLVWLGLASISVVVPFAWTYLGFMGARFNFEDSFEKIPLENRSIVERGNLNEAAIQILLDHPVQGVGLGTAALAIKRYYPNFPGNFVPPHFAVLAAALETGILGAVSFLWLLICPWFALARERISLTHNPLLTTTTALLLAITLVGVFDIYPWLPATGRLWHWLIWGWWTAAYEMKT